jgi:hypothetical protein
MKKFALESGGNILYCGTDGSVADAAHVIGKWTTTNDNKIRITANTGTSTEIKVDWSFNNSNQLSIAQNGKEVIRLTGTDISPRYSLAKNILQVDPDGDMDFTFPLNCTWGLTDTAKLKVTINGTVSEVDGYLEDNKSRFRFWFYDKERPIAPSNLIFDGKWESVDKVGKAVVTVTDQVRLHYVLDDLSLEDTKAPLILPGNAKVDPKRNHLYFTYNYATHGTRTLNFEGSLQIKSNWTLSFAIRDTQGGGVRKSRIEVATTFDWDRGSGTIQLYVGNTKSAGGQKLEIGGTIKAKIGATGINMAFDYLKDTAGGVQTITLAASVTFESKNGAIVVSYTIAGKNWKLDITAKLVKEDFVLVGGVAISNDTQGRRLGGFVGIRW